MIRKILHFTAISFLDVLRSQKLIVEFTKRDFTQQYIKSFLGILWAFIHPVVFVSVLWFVFTMGLRGQSSVGDVPFIVYLLSGYVAWFFISETLTAGAGVIQSYSFLVKKSDFKLHILPVDKIYSATIIHVFLLLLVMGILLQKDVEPGIFWFQTLYYTVAAMLLMLGVGWLTSSLSIFIPDVKEVVSALTRIGFWATPIFWVIDFLPETIQKILKLNPAFYIVNGYRESLLYGIGFWEHPIWTMYFWGLTLILLLAGAVVYHLTRPHFAEVI